MAKIFNDFHFQIFVQMFVFKDDCSAKGHRIWLENLRILNLRHMYYSSAICIFLENF
jgi:hypothetical protein